MDWIPAVSTTALFGFILWISRTWIITRLTKSIQHEYDAKIETLKAENKRVIDAFRQDLNDKANQISILRNTGLTGLTERQNILIKKRIEAAEAIWGIVINLAPLKVASAFMVHIKFDKATKEAATNAQFRSIFETLSGNFDVTKIPIKDVNRLRLFIPEMPWAIYSAYTSILFYTLMQVNMLKQGLDFPDLLSDKSTTKLLKSILPHYTNYLDEFGSAGYHYLLEDLEKMLLEELKKMINGHEFNKENIEKAGEIISAAQEVMAQIQKQQ